MLILIVEDDDAIRWTLKMIVESLDHKVLLAEDIPDALRILQIVKPDLILLDMFLKGQYGLKIIDAAREFFSPIPPIVLMSALSNIDQIAKEAQIQTVIKKPFDIDILEEIIRSYEI